MTSADEPALELPGLVRDRVAEGRAKAARTRARKVAEAAIADVDPVAGVVLDLPLAHLDRVFDYAVPAAFADEVRPGVRVKVRFGGQDVDGYVVHRGAETDHTGRLVPIRRVISAEQVLTPQVHALTQRVAERCAGTRSDVRRLAIPPRHAGVEKEEQAARPAGQPAPAPAHADVTGWDAYPTAPAFLSHVQAGHAPRAVWSVAPGEDWPTLLAEAAARTLAGGRGALLCLPDQRDVARVSAALEAVLGPGHHVTLSAEPGPAQRYRDFLAVLRGRVRVVVGTRSAAFAPVQDLGLVVIWDDGDDSHAEPRAPYPQVREVLIDRSEEEGAAFLGGGFARSVEADGLLASGWAREIALPRERRRDRVLVSVTGASEHALRRDPHASVARIPAEVVQALRWGVERGPVLVQTPRTGYALRLACATCRTPARCRVCTGPLHLPDPISAPQCRWCSVSEPAWTCGTCGGHGLRAPVLGDARTAEELGRMLPRVPVLTSSGAAIRDHVDAQPRLVVATPGAEPIAAGGYAAVVLLDTWLALGGEGLRVAEEATRRWCNAVGLVRPGGRALAVGDPAHPALQALVRWDPEGLARREAAERSEAGLPPATTFVELSGEGGALEDFLTIAELPDAAEVLGIAEAGRVLLRVPRTDRAGLCAALIEAQRVRSARRLDPVRVRLDPPDL